MPDEEEVLERWAMVHETRAREYYVSNFGKVLSITKKHHVEHKITPYFKGTPGAGFVLVKLGDREVALKYLILEAFVPGFKRQRACSINVVHRDGDIWNCALANLEVKTKAEVAAVTGPMSRSCPVRVRYDDGREECFSSIRACARGLFVSYQTVLDFLNGRYKSTVLDGLVIEYVK